MSVTFVCQLVAILRRNDSPTGLTVSHLAPLAMQDAMAPSPDTSGTTTYTSPQIKRQPSSSPTLQIRNTL
jgi:hypothetical protein